MDNKNIFYIFLAVFVLLGVSFVFGAFTTTLISPGDNTWNTSNLINFQFKCVGNYSWYNATLYIDGAVNTTYGNSTGIVKNDTTSNITITLNDKTSYLWNVECCNASGAECYLATANYTIKVDATDPSSGSITMPKSTTIFAQRSIKIKCSGEDVTSGMNYVKLKITKPSKKTIEVTLDPGKEKTFRGVDTGEAGKYLVDCTVYDAAGNTLSTEQKSFWVYYRTVKSAAPEEEPEEEIAPEEEKAPEEEGVPEEGVPVKAEKAPSKAWIWILVIIVIVLILYFVLKKKK